MQINYFSIQKYRSITRAQKLPLGKVTALIGPNNEGKSNILRALVVGMRALSSRPEARFASRPFYTRLPRDRADQIPDSYIWERDFPKSLQEKSPNGRTILDYEFELSASELDEFRSEVGSRLNGVLPIRLLIGRKGEVEFSIMKQGPGKQALTDKSKQIRQFIAKCIHLQYIPSVRTAREASNVVDEMVSSALMPLELSDDFQAAVASIEALQEPILREISENIRDMLTEFLPDVVGVNVSISNDDRYRALRALTQITVDDGNATGLQFKGDGVQSLAAIALLRRASSEAERANRELVLAIEEPEAHLHPHAIHQLKTLLEDIGSKQQVILTTHSPLLALRTSVESNIIVHQSRARPAKRISEVRDVLGVRTSDNLTHARVVLVLEGEDDTTIVRSYIERKHPRLMKRLSQGDLAIESLGGAGNLAYKLGELRTALCQYHVLLDNDQPGRNAAKKAEDGKLLLESERTFSMCPSMHNSEIEDLIHPRVYRQLLINRWNVDINNARFKSTGKKWSERTKEAFLGAGQPWTDSVEMKVKSAVADAVKTQADDPFVMAKCGPIKAVCRSLEASLEMEDEQAP